MQSIQTKAPPKEMLRMLPQDNTEAVEAERIGWFGDNPSVTEQTSSFEGMPAMGSIVFNGQELQQPTTRGTDAESNAVSNVVSDAESALDAASSFAKWIFPEAVTAVGGVLELGQYIATGQTSEGSQNFSNQETEQTSEEAAQKAEQVFRQTRYREVQARQAQVDNRARAEDLVRIIGKPQITEQDAQDAGYQAGNTRNLRGSYHWVNIRAARAANKAKEDAAKKSPKPSIFARGAKSLKALGYVIRKVFDPNRAPELANSGIKALG